MKGSKQFKWSIGYILTMTILFVFGQTSCRPKPLKIEVESAPPKLVVFSHVVPEKSMIVSLTKSFSALDGFDENDISSVLVSGAVVQIKFDNQLFDFIEINPGIYISYNEAYQVNQEYELIITYNGETVTAKTTMLPAVPFTNCLPEVIKNPGDTNVFVNVAFNDVNTNDQWYMVNIYSKGSGSNSLDGVNYFQNGTNIPVITKLMSDKEFGSTFSQRIELKNVGPNDSIVVTLSSINQKYYDYLKFRGDGGGNLLTQLNLEPIDYPTNIVNGYGFFNAHHPSLELFDLSQF